MPHGEIVAFVVFAALMSGVMDNSQPLLLERTEPVVVQVAETEAPAPAEYALPTFF